MKNSDKKWVLKRKHAQLKISRVDIKYLKDDFVSIEYLVKGVLPSRGFTKFSIKVA